MFQNIKTQKDVILSWSKNLLQECFSENTRNIITVQRNTNFHYLLLAENSQSDIVFEIQGENVVWNIYAIYFGYNSLKSNILVNILSSNSKINVFMLSLLTTDKAFDTDWNVFLWKNISNSQWHLLQKSLILWENIQVKSVPRLDVYSNDIQASHWFSVDRLNTEKLFYLNSKWLTESVSKDMIIRGNVEAILDKFVHLSDFHKNQIIQRVLKLEIL